MGRYIQDAGINQPLDVVSMTMEDYIYHNRYIRTDWNGEPVYQCIDASGKDRYLKWSYINGTLHVEAWMKGAFGEEADLNGIGKEKREYKDSIDNLITKLRTHSGKMPDAGYIGHDPIQNCSTEQSATYGQQSAYAHTGTTQSAYSQSQPTFGQQSAYSQSQSAYGQSGSAAQTGTYSQQAGAPNQQPTYTSSWMGGGTGSSRSFTSSAHMPNMPAGNPAAGSETIVFGVLAIVFCFIFPIVGLIFAILGKSRYAAVLNENPDNSTAKTGARLCKIALIIAIAVFMISFFGPFLFSFLFIFQNF